MGFVAFLIRLAYINECLYTCYTLLSIVKFKLALTLVCLTEVPVQGYVCMVLGDRGARKRTLVAVT